MTATERAKRSDALYYETVSVTRRVLCDMIANREADLEDARESVNRLMTQRDERLARAEAENAKLRMLIDLKQTCWKYAGWCDECPFNGLDDEHDDCNCTVREKVNLLARELGVEADG